MRYKITIATENDGDDGPIEFDCDSFRLEVLDTGETIESLSNDS